MFRIDAARDVNVQVAAGCAQQRHAVLTRQAPTQTRPLYICLMFMNSTVASMPVPHRDVMRITKAQDFGNSAAGRVDRASWGSRCRRRSERALVARMFYAVRWRGGRGSRASRALATRTTGSIRRTGG